MHPVIINSIYFTAPCKQIYILNLYIIYNLYIKVGMYNDISGSTHT